MEQPSSLLGLSPEQQHTADMLNRMLGKSIAHRYIDFCRLSAGVFSLNTSRPLAAHALRELDSTLRIVLAVPMDASATMADEEAGKVDEARKLLGTLGFDHSKIEQAIQKLEPPFSHKTQIGTIVSRLGLDPKGEVGRQWALLTDASGRAHERSFHISLKVDDEFRRRYQQPFDRVIRALAVALEDRYENLIRRVEELAGMSDKAKAAKLFAREIPAALPLQWHFFQRLTSGEWLTHLSTQNLLSEPALGSNEAFDDSVMLGQWPAGHYLLKMAKSEEAATRLGVSRAMQRLATSIHPAIQQVGMEILAVLPPDEAAPIANLAIEWLSNDTRNLPMRAPEALLGRLAMAGHHEAALQVARALLRIWDIDGKIESHYSRHLYELHLPALATTLTDACGLKALRLFTDLLDQASAISGRINNIYYGVRTIATQRDIKHDIYESLVDAIRDTAVKIVTTSHDQMSAVISLFVEKEMRIFTLLIMHVLAKNPSKHPKVATAYLIDSNLIGEPWCQSEYAELALAWFPSLSPADQAIILSYVDSIPGKYIESWRTRFEQQTKAAPTTTNEREYCARVIQEAIWHWRAVLPQERQEVIARITEEFGQPDAWRHPFRSEESPISADEFSTWEIPKLTDFLRMWRPIEGPRRLTATALGLGLRRAASSNPAEYSKYADEFRCLKPLYVRCLLGAFVNTIVQGHCFNWERVLNLIQFVLTQYHAVLDPTAHVDGDDGSWVWSCMDAAELLGKGLRLGTIPFSFVHYDAIVLAISTGLRVAPKLSEIEDFEDRYEKDPLRAAQATLRGAMIENCVLMIFWATKDASQPCGKEPRAALEILTEIRLVLEKELADRTPAGRIPRAIIGHYLKSLQFFGESWLISQWDNLFPEDDVLLRQATWRSHLYHGNGPSGDLMSRLQGLYIDEINLMGRIDFKEDPDFSRHQGNRIAEYVMILYLWNVLPEHILNLFTTRAPAPILQHAMWFVGEQLSRPPPDAPAEFTSRGLAYWERQLTAALQDPKSNEHVAELGAIASWCFHGQIDELWLCNQLLGMLEAGYMPNDAFSVINWLEKIAPRHVDFAIEVLDLLLRHKDVDRWTYLTENGTIRALLKAGLSHGTNATRERARRTINFLLTFGQTGYRDLLD